jgi:hypothetical protein
MSSDSRKRQLRLYNEILQANTTADVSCDWCFLNNHLCYIMPNSTLKYAECTKLRKQYVNMSWALLDKTREEYRTKVEADKKLLSKVMLRLLRNKKILQQAKERARRKALCLASEMEANREDVNTMSINCPAALIRIAYSPLI